MKDKIYFKRVIAGTFLALLLVTAVFWIVPPEKYIGSYYPDFMQQRDYLYKDDNKSEVIILGDSSLKAAIRPELLCSNAYNLNLPGATPLEMYYSLETYLQHHPKPQAVIICFAFYHYAEMDRYQMWTFYNHYLTWQQELESQFIIFNYDDVPFLDRIPILWQDLQYRLRLPTKYYQTAFESRFKREKEFKKNYKRLSDAKGHSLYGDDPNWKEHFGPHPLLEIPYKKRPSLDLYMKKLLYLCKDNNIPVHVLQPPLHSWYYNLLQDRGYLKDFFNYFDELSEETGVIFDKEILIYDLDLFDDSIHLNEQGAEIYTKKIKEKLGL